MSVYENLILQISSMRERTEALKVVASEHFPATSEMGLRVASLAREFASIEAHLNTENARESLREVAPDQS